MQTRLAILTILILASCAPRFIPKSDPTQIALISPLPSEIQPTYAPTQGDIPNMAPFLSTPSAPGLPNLIEKAKEDLAQRLSISVDQINGIDVKSVIWSNSSLGCPQPGMLYAEVLTPGYLILLNANGQDYEYHAGKGSDIFLCENPLPPVDGMLDNT
jgi:hypothetical protein